MAHFPREYQGRVFLSLVRGLRALRGETFTVLFPRQSGKNEVAATLVATVLAGNALTGGGVVCCAPTFSPQAGISIERLRRAFEWLGPALPGGARPRFDGAVVRVGEAWATFLSASAKAHVAGHTASLALIADEAQEIDEAWFERQFRPMAASTGACTVLFGTPWDGSSLLDRAVARNRRRDAEREAAGYAFIPLHHEVGWRTVAAESPVYGAYVRAERERLGARHPLFLTQYELVTAETAGRLFAAEDLAAMEGRYPAQRGPSPGGRYVGGLDFGGDGDQADATVLTIARVDGGCREVVAHRVYRGRAYAAVEREIAGEVAHWRIEKVCADATGLGGPICGHLEAILAPGVLDRVVFTAASKSELGFALQAAVRRRGLSVYARDETPEAMAFWRELAVCRMRLSGGGQMGWEAPPGRHDDYVASLALCLRAAESLSPPRVARGRSGWDG